jgi:hypothetical protein
MKGQWMKGLQMVPILLASAVLGIAQTGTSAQQGTMPAPGTLNYVEGQVLVDGANVSANSVRSTVVKPGETVQTGDGHAEVLLTPGAYLRLGHNTEVRFLSAGLVDTRVELDRGSAMIEAADIVKGTNLGVNMENAKAQVVKKGLYSFDASQRTVQVFDGEAKVSEGDRSTTLKKGDEVLLASDQGLKKRDFNTKAEETAELYVWSKVRNEDEAQANYALANRFAVYGQSFVPGWYWDPYWNFYAFVPAWGAFYSPFGYPFYSPGFAYGYRPYFRAGVVHSYYGHGFGGFRAAGGVRAGGRR